MGTVALSVLKSDMFRILGFHWPGAATGGSTAKITDSTLIDLADSSWPFPLLGAQVRITSGSALGDLRQIVKVDKTTGDCYPNRAFSAAVASTNTYELWGNVIHGGTQLTDVFNRVLRRWPPVDQTQVTIVTSQNIYDITAVVSHPDDVREVWVRYLDKTLLEPYWPEPVDWWRAYALTATATPAIKLRIEPSLTLDTTARELWIEHHKALTAFTADTGTVSDIYRDWLAYEAAWLLAKERADNSPEPARWKALQTRIRTELLPLRERFYPRRQGRQLPEEPMFT